VEVVEKIVWGRWEEREEGGGKRFRFKEAKEE
jgi:hypothetical protein